MAKVHGYCDPRFVVLKEYFQKALDSVEELGASLTINIDDKDVVDLRGGWRDREKTQPWQEDTIVNVFSTTKNISALAMLLCIERGLVSAHDKVSKYWPEFAVNGKDGIEIRHIMSHTSGVSGWADSVTWGDICDVPYATAKLAEQAPFWEPGTASGYHANTMGHLIGEVIRRVTGKSLRQFVAEELAMPLSSDFFIGAPEKVWPRVSTLAETPAISLPPDASLVKQKTFGNPAVDPMWLLTAKSRLSELGASNGHGNAKSIANIMKVVSLGGKVAGKQFLSPETLDLVFQEQASGIDLVLDSPQRFGIGFGIRGDGEFPVDSLVPEGRICFWNGWGGSIVLMDLDRRLTISYAMNKMDGLGVSNKAGRFYVKTVYDILTV